MNNRPDHYAGRLPRRPSCLVRESATRTEAARLVIADFPRGAVLRIPPASGNGTILLLMQDGGETAYQARCRRGERARCSTP